ncbi:MAG: hypothetical protein AAF483_25485, partial [Planctomycetota bacterium]
MKLKSIQFYSSGMANFSYQAEVRSESVLSFLVPTSKVSDALRTISVNDPSGGLESILVLPNESSVPQPNSITDTVDASSRIDLLLSFRGEKIELDLKSGKRIQGQLLSVENSLEPLGEAMTERVRVSLLSESGVESTLLGEIRSFRCVNTKVQKKLKRAAEAMRQKSEANTSGNSSVALSKIEVHLAGKDAREVLISWMQAMPIWKCSYVLDEDSMRMHIVIDNPTNQDWEDVEIVIADGRPIAFDVNMHQQVRLSRQRLQLPVGLPGLPPMFAEQNSFQNQIPEPEQTASNAPFGYSGAGYGGGGYGMGGYGGYGGGMGGGMGGMGGGMTGGMGGMGGTFGGEPDDANSNAAPQTTLPYPSNLSLVVSDPQSSSLAFQK